MSYNTKRGRSYLRQLQLMHHVRFIDLIKLPIHAQSTHNPHVRVVSLALYTAK